MAPSLPSITSLLVLLLPTLARADWSGWTEGRASYYGDDGGASINQGSCMFGQLDYNAGTGYDIVALSDHDPDYAGSCGRCYEVACRDASFSDGYGQYLDRSGTCYDESKSVIVRVTDTCPCYYPNNAYSNKRWCCGDMRHLDLSAWAFRKLGKTSDGVMGVRFRAVNCPNYPTGTQQAQQAGSWGSSGSSSGSGNSNGNDNNNNNWSSSSSSSSSSSNNNWASASASSSGGGGSSSSSSSSSGGSSWASASASSSSSPFSFAPFSSNSAGGPWSSDWPNRTGRKMMGTASAQERQTPAPAH